MCHYRGEQVYAMSSMEELMPSLGTSVPSPSVLAVVLNQSNSILQNIAKTNAPNSNYLDNDPDNPFDFCDKSFIVSETHLISISDDGKLWNWILTAEGKPDTQKDDKKSNLIKDDSTSLVGTSANTTMTSKNCPSSSSFNPENILLKVSICVCAGVCT